MISRNNTSQRIRWTMVHELPPRTELLLTPPSPPQRHLLPRRDQEPGSLRLRRVLNQNLQHHNPRLPPLPDPQRRAQTRLSSHRHLSRRQKRRQRRFRGRVEDMEHLSGYGGVVREWQDRGCREGGRDMGDCAE